MNSLEERLLKLSNPYQDQVRKCNIKYDELVREYKKNKPQEYMSFSGGLKMALSMAFSMGWYAWVGTSVISCFTNCDDWWHCSEFWMESWYQLHVIIPTLIVMGICFLLGLYVNRSSNKTYKNVENSVNGLERERKRELDKLQRDYDIDRQQIIAQYNKNREVYLKQLRDSNNTLKLKEIVFSEFERVYEMIDKSVHIKDIIFEFGIAVNQEDIRIIVMQGRSRLHDMGYIYKRMQMKNLENTEACEALAVVISQEVDFMIKEQHKQAVTDVVIRDGVLVHIGFREPNMNYKGLNTW